MPTVVNTHQAEAWNGYEGHHWAEHQHRYDAVNEGMNTPLFEAAAINATDRVLDIGCGTGQTTRLAACLATHGHVLGIDLSGPMLERARASAAAQGLANVAFEQGDAQVHTLAPGGFDVAVSRGGIMFFADPVAAFGNIGRALRPGGRLAFVCPTSLRPDDDFVRALTPLWALMRRHSPAAGATGVLDPSPVSLVDPDRIEDVLTRAGFTDISTVPVDVPMVFGHTAEEAAEFLFAMGPMRFNLASAGPADVDQARAEVTGALGGFNVAGEVTLRTAMWLVSAVRSAPAA